MLPWYRICSAATTALAMDGLQIGNFQIRVKRAAPQHPPRHPYAGNNSRPPPQQGPYAAAPRPGDMRLPPAQVCFTRETGHRCHIVMPHPGTKSAASCRRIACSCITWGLQGSKTVDELLPIPAAGGRAAT